MIKEPMSLRTPGFFLRDDQDGVAGDVATPMRHNRRGSRKGKRQGKRKEARK